MLLSSYFSRFLFTLLRLHFNRKFETFFQKICIFTASKMLTFYSMLTQLNFGHKIVILPNSVFALCPPCALNSELLSYFIYPGINNPGSINRSKSICIGLSTRYWIPSSTSNSLLFAFHSSSLISYYYPFHVPSLPRGPYSVHFLSTYFPSTLFLSRLSLPSNNHLSLSHRLS